MKIVRSQEEATDEQNEWTETTLFAEDDDPLIEKPKRD